MIVGVLGGGQLGRMLALAGIPLGLRFRFLDPSPQAPARDVGELIVGGFDDPAVRRRFAKGLAAVTYEFENVPVSCVEAIARLGRRSSLGVCPNAESLRTAQDRLLEKRLFERVGLRVPRYLPIDSQAQLDAAVASIGLPVVLKTRRMGYDGKGQRVLRKAADARGAVAALAPHAARPESAPANLIVEQFVRFDREVSIIAVGARGGGGVCYPLVENQHREGILRTSRIPSLGVGRAVWSRAEAAVWRIVAELDYVGVLAIEFFMQDGELLANEMAPRVHNSGHWTIDGALTSQFENHLRAILGWPLGSPAPRGPCVMHNLIGSIPPVDALLDVDGARVHLYGKEPRAGRKVGHVTVLADGDGLESASRRIARIIKRSG